MRDPGREQVVLVIGWQAFGDDDRILHVLSAGEGRAAVFVRGGQKRGLGLDIGVRAKITVRGRVNGMGTLIRAEVEDARVHLRNSYARLVLMQYACELAGAFVQEGHAEPRQFALLETTLLVLDACTADPGRAFLAAFELKVLTFAGVGPEVFRAIPRLERLRQARLVEILDDPLDAEAESLVYDAVREHLGRELGARTLLSGIDWP